MSDQITLQGRFVNLRPLTIQDAALSLRWRQSERALHLNRGAPTEDAQACWIATRPPSEFNFIIELCSGAPVGMLALIDIDQSNRHAESARFLIGEEAAVRGIPVAAEAMFLLLELAFETLDMHRVHGTVASGNALMIKWQKYVGMREEGRLRDHYFLNNHYHDAVCLGLLVDEYRTVTRPRLTSLIRMGHTPTS
jgi:RimJ/RimL family protein N-acetyltransferase